MELQIKITTSAELGGAEKAKSILEQTVSQKKFLNQEHAQEEALLKRVQSSIAEYKAEVEKATVAKQQMASVDLDPGLEERLSNEYGAGNSAATIHAEEVRRRRNAAAAQIASDRQSSRANREAMFLAQWSGESTKATKAANDHADAVAKGAKQVGFFNKETKESQALLQSLAMSGLPGVGLAATAAFSATTAGISSVVLGLVQLVDHIAETHREMQELLALEPAFLRHADAIRGLANAQREARVESAAYYDELARIVAKQGEVARQIDHTTAAHKAQVTEMQAVGKANEGLFQQALALAVARGQITQEEADYHNAVAAFRALEQKANAERLAEMEVIDAKEKELAEARKTLESTPSEIDTLRDQLAKDEAQLKRNEEDIALASKVAAPTSVARQELAQVDSAYQKAAADSRVAGVAPENLAAREREIREMLRNGMGADNSTLLGELGAIETFTRLRDQRAKLQGSINNAQSVVSTLPDQNAELRIEMDRRKKDLEEREATLRTATERSGQLPGELNDLTGQFRANEAGRSREVEGSRALGQIRFESDPRDPSANARLAEIIRQSAPGREVAATGRSVASQISALSDEFVRALQSVGAVSADAVADLRREVDAVNKRILANRYRR